MSTTRLKCEIGRPIILTTTKINLLIGASNLFELIEPGQTKISNKTPLLRETQFEWIAAE